MRPPPNSAVAADVALAALGTTQLNASRWADSIGAATTYSGFVGQLQDRVASLLRESEAEFRQLRHPGCDFRDVPSGLGFDQDAERTGEHDADEFGVTTGESVVEDEQGVAFMSDGDRFSLALSEVGGQCQQCQGGRRNNSCPRKIGDIRDIVSCSTASGEFLDDAGWDEHLAVQRGQQIDAAELVQIQQR